MTIATNQPPEPLMQLADEAFGKCAMSLHSAGLAIFAHGASEEELVKLTDSLSGEDQGNAFWRDAVKADLEKIAEDAIVNYVRVIMRVLDIEIADTAGEGFGDES